MDLAQHRPRAFFPLLAVRRRRLDRGLQEIAEKRDVLPQVIDPDRGVDQDLHGRFLVFL